MNQAASKFLHAHGIAHVWSSQRNCFRCIAQYSVRRNGKNDVQSFVEIEDVRVENVRHWLGY